MSSDILFKFDQNLKFDKSKTGQFWNIFLNFRSFEKQERPRKRQAEHTHDNNNNGEGRCDHAHDGTMRKDTTPLRAALISNELRTSGRRDT